MEAELGSPTVNMRAELESQTQQMSSRFAGEANDMVASFNAQAGVLDHTCDSLPGENVQAKEEVRQLQGQISGQEEQIMEYRQRDISGIASLNGELAGQKQAHEAIIQGPRQADGRHVQGFARITQEKHNVKIEGTL
jgi:hypothetical protein